MATPDIGIINLMNNDNLQQILTAWLAGRLNAQALAFLENSRAEIAAGVNNSRFAQLIALASRHARRNSLAPSHSECQQAAVALPGWDPVDWNLLETLRIALILARPDLTTDNFTQGFESAFQYADEGELCAFYRAIPLLPEAQRFVWRAGEACRTNMASVFRAMACDNPYPVTHFDAIAWQQLLMKALFIGVPLWRIYGLDQRLSATLAVMVLDYMDERTSAGRGIPVDAWLLLGPHWNERAVQAAERALTGDAANRRAAILALGRAGQKAHLAQMLASEADPAILFSIRQALSGAIAPSAYQALSDRE